MQSPLEGKRKLKLGSFGKVVFAKRYHHFQLCRDQEAKKIVRGVMTRLRGGKLLEAHLAAHLCAANWHEEATLHSGGLSPEVL